jgi:hypothetical protein
MFPAFVAGRTGICELMGRKWDLIMKLEFRGSSQRNLALLFAASAEYVAPAWQDLRQSEFAPYFPFSSLKNSDGRQKNHKKRRQPAKIQIHGLSAVTARLGMSMRYWMKSTVAFSCTVVKSKASGITRYRSMSLMLELREMRSGLLTAISLNMPRPQS